MKELIFDCIQKGVEEMLIEEFLYETCEREHSSCNNDCPVYESNVGVPNESNSKRGCDCFKDGKKMLKFLKNKREERSNR